MSKLHAYVVPVGLTFTLALSAMVTALSSLLPGVFVLVLGCGILEVYARALRHVRRLARQRDELIAEIGVELDALRTMVLPQDLLRNLRRLEHNYVTDKVTDWNSFQKELQTLAQQAERRRDAAGRREEIRNRSARERLAREEAQRAFEAALEREAALVISQALTHPNFQVADEKAKRKTVAVYARQLQDAMHSVEEIVDCAMQRMAQPA